MSMKKGLSWTLLISAFIVIAVIAIMYWKRKRMYSDHATINPPPGYKVDISPPRSLTNTWLTYNGSTLLVPLRVCGKWHHDFVIDTGSGRLVTLNQKPCVDVAPKKVNLSYGSMGVEAVKTTQPLDVQVGALKMEIKMPTAYFADACTRGHCANILGLMPPESGGTFPHHSFSIIFDGVGGGWFALYPDPPDNAIPIEYTIIKGFYTLPNVQIVNPRTGERKKRHAAVDSGTTLVEFPAGVDISEPLDIYTGDGKTKLASLQPRDMDTSAAVSSAFPDQTFVLGLPFFRKKHVAFNGDEKRIYIWA